MNAAFLLLVEKGRIEIAALAARELAKRGVSSWRGLGS